jgi:hypothetical protein
MTKGKKTPPPGTLVRGPGPIRHAMTQTLKGLMTDWENRPGKRGGGKHTGKS